MTKSERLIFLVNLIKQRRVATVPEMSAACGVTQRTIYRDMLALSRMSVPIYYENGYRLARETLFPSQQFSPDDIDLILYSLRHNPLNQHPYFARRFYSLEQRVLSAFAGHRTTGPLQESRLLIDRRLPSVPRSAEIVLLERFLRASMECRRVELKLRDSGELLASVVPVAVRILTDDILLILLETGQTRARRISVRQVSELRIREERFDPNLAERVRQRLALQKKEPTSQ